MLINRPLHNASPGFDLDRAKELLNLVSIAHDRYDYAKKHLDWNWESDFAQIKTEAGQYEVLANLGFTQFFLWRRRVPFGFIARREVSPGRFKIFVVFRGTMNPAEWISNFKFFQSSYQKKENPTLPVNPQNQSISPKDIGKIHWGFYKTYTRSDPGNWLDKLINLASRIKRVKHQPMRDVIENVLLNAEQCPPTARVFVTGHSLGGALATLSALHIHASQNIPYDFPILYSFASPRVGDRQFAQHFQKLECYRIANSEDIVPVVPLPSLLLAAGRIPLRQIAAPSAKSLVGRLQYEHIGQPIYFTSQNGSVAQNHIIPAYETALEQIS